MIKTKDKKKTGPVVYVFNDRKLNFVLLLFLSLLIIISFTMGYSFYGIINTPSLSIKSAYSNYDIQTDSLSSFSDTHSMEPGITHRDLGLWRGLNDSENLLLGHVYSYDVVNSSGNIIHISHRLIGRCSDEQLLFKGDNNWYADELVNRSQVTDELIGLCFNGWCRN